MGQRERIDTLADAAVAAIAHMLGAEPESVSTTMPFTDLGLSSAQLARLTGVLEDALGVEISLTELYDNPDIERLVDHLEGR
ncbi:acyl carrier protein [Nocardia kruczakiae]|uniref:Acyl carrier protein n=1 Tax=Nocardia kruczakiae TaxID=261477 RepID=A0ABU1XBC3_9NOCA|nr:acyl carrier protein [Nocardia kruczakiae]MDR7167838.1 acyl carrier protein [Nocardia kruczakiae]